MRYNSDHPRGYYNTGIDILASINTPVKSLLCGEVVEAYDTEGDLGIVITIKSKDKNDKFVWIKYCHLNSIDVMLKDKITHNFIIGKSGNSGNAQYIEVKYYHIHIEASTDGIFYGGKQRVDPENYMKTKFDDSINGNVIK